MLALLMASMFALDVTANETPPTAEQLRFFESNVRPVLVEHCFPCHGPKKQWGTLRLDSRDAVLTGGDSGAAIVLGKPNESLLITAIRHVDPDLKMPKDSKLSDRQIADLTRWVEIGAPFPQFNRDTSGPQRLRDRNHWAFQPPTTPSIPVVKNSEWTRSELDFFIAAKLEAANIRPAPRADKRTLIRRVTFDLTGLPPTPAEIDSFLKDDCESAFAKVVDRLLASPSYGERWGRHWLDVARYADSNGLDENVAHGNAWRYRDYVVASFNNDKPFDRFILEQLAGDPLPFESEAQQHEQLIATGFLGIGPKVLAETDEAKMRMDMIDEQLETTGRAFLGMTLGCARCHDHKFDPISTADYYGLAGIFKSTKSMRKYTKLAEWYEALLPSAEATAMQQEFDAKVATKKKAIAEFIAAADQAVKDKLTAENKSTQPPDQLELLYPEATTANLKKLRDELVAIEKAVPNLPSAMGVTEDNVVDVAIHVRGNPLKLGDVIPRRMPSVMRGPQPTNISATESGRRQLALWLVHPQHPLTARVFVNRMWRWHFGQGLVRSTDNFGLLGEAPSHPELLDWLARRFMADNWSIKSLHRVILHSSTYQQAAVASTETLATDPENRLCSRTNVRRLEAEAIRDAMLAISGQFDSKLGGSLLKLKNREYFFDHTSKDATSYDSRRRSIYLPVVRNNVFDMLQLLDFADPTISTGHRTSTVVAPQALLMLNSDFVMQAASDFATRLKIETTDEDARLTRLYELAFAREPTTSERQHDRVFLAAAAAQAHQGDELSRGQFAWAALCHVAFASNEFIYLK